MRWEFVAKERAKRGKKEENNPLCPAGHESSVEKSVKRGMKEENNPLCPARYELSGKKSVMWGMIERIYQLCPTGNKKCAWLQICNMKKYD